MDIRLAGVVSESVVDGPGIRYVIFAQGCSHNCLGCHNPETHDFNGGYVESIENILSDINKSKHIDGVTFSGGDPFFQPEGFEYLAEKLKEKGYKIMSYTGFLFEDMIKNEKMLGVLRNIDILVDGPFIESKCTHKLHFRGSSNQRIIDVPKSLINKSIILKDFD